MIKNKQRVIQITLGVITLLFAGWIFSNSMKTAAVSSVQSDNVKAMLQTVISTLFPNSSFKLTSHIVRKLAHFSEYALFGFLLYLSCRECMAKHRYFLVASGVSAVAFIDEGLQFFYDGRGPSLRDVAIDISGGHFGLLCAVIFFAVIVKRITAKVARDRERSPKLKGVRRLGWTFPRLGAAGAFGAA